MNLAQIKAQIKSKSTSNAITYLMSKTEGKYTEAELEEAYSTITTAINSNLENSELEQICNDYSITFSQGQALDALNIERIKIYNDLKYLAIIKSEYNSSTIAEAINAIKTEEIENEPFEDLEPNQPAAPYQPAGKSIVQIYRDLGTQGAQATLSQTYTPQEVENLIKKNNQNKSYEDIVLSLKDPLFFDINRNHSAIANKYTIPNTIDSCNDFKNKLQEDLFTIEYLKNVYDCETIQQIINNIFD